MSYKSIESGKFVEEFTGHKMIIIPKRRKAIWPVALEKASGRGISLSLEKVPPATFSKL